MTTERDDLIRNYQNHLKEEKENELSENSELIRNFTEFSSEKKVFLQNENFDYVPTIGIIVTYPNIVALLNNNIKEDKEGLVEVSILEKEFIKKPFATGYYYSDKYMVMAHPYFRRGHRNNSNFSPRFVEEFWRLNKPENFKYISIDCDRVRINVDNRMYMEFDTWFGAKFKKNISEIEDGIIKLRPPLDLDSFDIDFLFGNTYSVDIKWSSKEGIKVFQLEEFKSEKEKITKDGIEYFPVKYIHAEYDQISEKNRHFDGAIHFYTMEEYYLRRDEDFNYNTKNNLQLKTLSQKLFKINGKVELTDWINLVSHYLTADPLIFEYFEGKYPDHVVEYIEKIRISKENSSP